jgi:hypothetical protein
MYILVDTSMCHNSLLQQQKTFSLKESALKPHSDSFSSCFSTVALVADYLGAANSKIVNIVLFFLHYNKPKTPSSGS